MRFNALRALRGEVEDRDRRPYFSTVPSDLTQPFYTVVKTTTNTWPEKTDCRVYLRQRAIKPAAAPVGETRSDEKNRRRHSRRREYIQMQ